MITDSFAHRNVMSYHDLEIRLQEKVNDHIDDTGPMKCVGDASGSTSSCGSFIYHSNINNSDYALLATSDETDEALQVWRSYANVACIYEEVFRESRTAVLPLRWITSSTCMASWPLCFSESVPPFDSFLESDDLSCLVEGDPIREGETENDAVYRSRHDQW